MEVAEYIALISTVVSLTSLAVVLIELGFSRSQSKSHTLIQIYDINRQLLSLGFSHPELFKVIGVKQGELKDDVFERRYLQLWLNQMALVHHFKDRGLFTSSQWNSLQADMESFMNLPQMHEQWNVYGAYYPSDFQEFIKSLDQENEHKKGEAHKDASP